MFWESEAMLQKKLLENEFKSLENLNDWMDNHLLEMDNFQISKEKNMSKLTWHLTIYCRHSTVITLPTHFFLAKGLQESVMSYDNSIFYTNIQSNQVCPFFKFSTTPILFIDNSLLVGFISTSRIGTRFWIGKMALNPSSALLLCIQPQTTHLASLINSVNFILFTSKIRKKKIYKVEVFNVIFTEPNIVNHIYEYYPY